MSTYIEFQNVKKIYKMGEVEAQALAGVDFTIDRGEFVVTAGASGTGKSTILNILGGMNSSTSGNIFVDGAEISRSDAKQLTTYRRYDIGFIFQFYNLVQNLIVKESVELTTQICKQPLNIDGTIEAVGLKERASNFLAQLSGGEQQRMAVARALAKNPKLLLCDEPTGALNYNTGRQTLELPRDTYRQRGVSVVVIIRDLTLTAMGDKVVKVRNGKTDNITINEHPLPAERIEY